MDNRNLLAKFFHIKRKSQHSNNNKKNALKRDETASYGLFEQLPMEVIFSIFSYLPKDQLAKLATVSKGIRDISEDNLFWKRFVDKDLINPNSNQSLKPLAKVMHATPTGTLLTHLQTFLEAVRKQELCVFGVNTSVTYLFTKLLAPTKPNRGFFHRKDKNPQQIPFSFANLKQTLTVIQKLLSIMTPPFFNGYTHSDPYGLSNFYRILINSATQVGMNAVIYSQPHCFECIVNFLSERPEQSKVNLLSLCLENSELTTNQYFANQIKIIIDRIKTDEFTTQRQVLDFVLSFTYETREHSYLGRRGTWHVERF